jgi:hypothetical protein
MKRFVAVGLATAGFLFSLGVTRAHAQGASDSALPPASALANSPIVQQLMNDPAFRKAATGATSARANAAKLRLITFKDSAPPSEVVNRLVATFPADRQETLRSGIGGLVAFFPEVEKQFGLPHNDVGAAAAFFVAASGQSYAGADFDTVTQFRPLITQMRNAMAANANVTKASEADKRDFFDQMMILGLFQFSAQESVNKTPNAEVSAQLRTSGAEYLKALLGVEPASLQFTTKGLRIGVPGTTGITNGAGSPAAPSPASPNSPANPPKGGEVSSEASAASDQVETVGFWTKTSYGFGGSLTFNPAPMVLFRNGDALYEIEGLKFPGGIAAHRAANPDDWTTWRRAGGGFEILGKKGWSKLPYKTSMGRLPKGFVLDRSYQSTGGGGNVAVGGSSAVVVWSNLTFDRAGNFTSEGGAGSTTDGVVTSGSSSSQGRYSIEGYTMTLKYGDGRVEIRMIVADPNDTGVIWLDGTGYTSKK